LDNIERVFLTDEVETHALSAVGFEIHHGELSPSPGCPVAANLLCRRFLTWLEDLSIAFQ
jgi:hypothetical protein